MKLLSLVCALLAVATVGQKDYKHLLGQQVRMCGTVITYTHEGDDCDVRLDLGQPYWNSAFYVLVPNAARERFVTPPEDAYLHKGVCIAGLVQADKNGLPHIVADQPSQFEVTKDHDEMPFGAGVRRSCGPVRAPRVLKEVQPNYSRKGIAANIQGRVLLDAIVGADGKVSDVRVVYSLEPSLDEEAKKAIKKWRFAPATLNGSPVPALVSVEMSFTLTQ